MKEHPIIFNKIFSNRRRHMSSQKEKPIIFSSEMVRAILDGRKTQTRRVIRPQPRDMKDQQVWPNDDGNWSYWIDGSVWRNFKCPYGQPGDKLWVREGWKTSSMSHRTPTNAPEEVVYCVSYRTGYGRFPHCKTIRMDKPVNNAWQKNRDGWRPSIHMPRWASRITLEVVSVKVERVQEISHEDALAEGIDKDSPYNDYGTGSIYRDTFAALWDKINAKRGFGWDVNPWCWRVEFKHVGGCRETNT